MAPRRPSRGRVILLPLLLLVGSVVWAASGDAIVVLQHDDGVNGLQLVAQVRAECTAVCERRRGVCDDAGPNNVHLLKQRGRYTALWTSAATIVCPNQSSVPRPLSIVAVHRNAHAALLPSPWAPAVRTSSALSATTPQDEYRSWSSAEAFLQSLPQVPGLRRDVSTVASSQEGRRIQAVCITSAQGSTTEAMPTLLVVGGHHAREWISVEVALRMVDRFAVGFRSNRRIRALLTSLRVCIVPNLNPDGYLFSWLPGWEGSRPRRMWRKNRHALGNNVFGVDLNRNYPVDWNDPQGASLRPDDETYRGGAPLSESETKSFYNWQLQLPLVGFVSLHSYGNQIMFPYGYRRDAFGPNEAFLRNLSVVMQRAVANTTGVVYDVLKAANAYPCSGDAVDAVYAAHNFAPSITIETRPSMTGCCGFVLDPALIEVATTECFTAVAALGEYVAGVVQRSGGTVQWQHHVFEASSAPSVSAASNYSATDWTVFSELDALVVATGTRRMVMWLRVAQLGGPFASDADAEEETTALPRTLDLRRAVWTRLVDVLGCHSSEVDVMRAVYLISWDAISVVAQLHTTSRDRTQELFARLVGLLDVDSGPRGRPAVQAV